MELNFKNVENVHPATPPKILPATVPTPHIEQTPREILKRQCPSIFSISRHCIKDFRDFLFDQRPPSWTARLSSNSEKSGPRTFTTQTQCRILLRMRAFVYKQVVHQEHLYTSTCIRVRVEWVLCVIDMGRKRKKGKRKNKKVYMRECCVYRQIERKEDK